VSLFVRKLTEISGQSALWIHLFAFALICSLARLRRNATAHSWCPTHSQNIFLCSDTLAQTMAYNMRCTLLTLAGVLTYALLAQAITSGWLFTDPQQSCRTACGYSEGVCHEHDTLYLDDLHKVQQVVNSMFLSDPPTCDVNNPLFGVDLAAPEISTDSYETELGKTCDIVDANQQICCCDPLGCSIDCVEESSWSVWSSCDYSNCPTSARSSRTRSLLVESYRNGITCPSVEYESCNCPIYSSCADALANASPHATGTFDIQAGSLDVTSGIHIFNCQLLPTCLVPARYGCSSVMR
jgi:hypothetical protein